MKELNRQQSLGMNFRDFQLEAWLLGALQVVVDWKVSTARAYLRVSTTELGIW